MLSSSFLSARKKSAEAAISDNKHSMIDAVILPGLYVQRLLCCEYNCLLDIEFWTTGEFIHASHPVTAYTVNVVKQAASNPCFSRLWTQALITIGFFLMGTFVASPPCYIYSYDELSSITSYLNPRI